MVSKTLIFSLVTTAAVVTLFGVLWHIRPDVPHLPPPEIQQPGSVEVVVKQPTGNPLAGKKLRYLIGGGGQAEKPGEIVEVSYDSNGPGTIKYGNLFDEKNTGKYGPYLRGDDVSSQYGEGRINPKGAGWGRNIADQVDRAKRWRFQYIEWDNPDSYTTADAVDAVNRTVGIGVIAKNAGLMSGPCPYVGHRNVFGLIVEKGAGTPKSMDDLRKACGKPNLPVWFVSFGSGFDWARVIARQAKFFKGMYVTYSVQGEYGSSADVVP